MTFFVKYSAGHINGTMRCNWAGAQQDAIDSVKRIINRRIEKFHPDLKGCEQSYEVVDVVGHDMEVYY